MYLAFKYDSSETHATNFIEWLKRYNYYIEEM